MRYLVDTNVISETRKRQPEPLVLKWFASVNSADLYFSVLTIGEIMKWIEAMAARDPRASAALREWLVGLRDLYADRMLPVDGAVAEEWGRLAAQRPIPMVDGLIAATARVRGMTLVTRNVRDVEGLPVTVHNPWIAGP